MASSSSSDDSHVKHDVFISFSGPDTRRGFLSHLVKELRREKIKVYVDKDLNRGEEISSSLVRAIQESQISMVILSQNFPSSRWCMDELEEVIKCMEKNRQIVLPVFHYIDPSDVRHQKGAYESAFADHELKFQSKVQNWRLALEKAAGLTGFVASHYDDDSELIDDIVKDVLVRLKDIYPNESKDLVGIDLHLDRIRSFLDMESKEVQILGIWGMSGIGKTTIAQVAYDRFSLHYEGSCFLDNVRESENHGLKSLRQKIISELQEEKSTFLQKRLISRRKVLIVIDDVGTPEQLQYLVTGGSSLGPGSRVIVTSRDRQALIAGGVHAILEVKELDFEESLKLFSLNAFKNSHPEKGYEELSKRAVTYAKGLPLALKILGLHLYSGDRKVWESTLRKLGMHPHPQIHNVLKVSYDGLDDVERDIFLDIAFFYKGEDKDHAIRLLNANDLFAASGIKRLIDKALISISNDNIIQMHVLIQEMGWEIVRQECKENPGKRSRLKDFEEVHDVLKNNRGTDAIKGVVLYASLFKDVQLNGVTFKNMTNLRVVKFYSPWLLRFCNVHHSTCVEPFSDESMCRKWGQYPFYSLQSSFHLEKLVEHSMPNTHVKTLWNLVQDYVNSKSISRGRSKQSMEFLEFSKASKFEWDDICHFQCSCNVNPNILSLSMIVALNLVHYSKTLRSESNFRSLRNFDASFCFSVKEFSLSSKEISDTDLGTSRFEILYSSIGGSRPEILPLNELGCLRYFEELNLSDCRRMHQSPELHNLFDAILRLEELFMAGCKDFSKFLISSLKYMGLKETSIDSLPASIKDFTLLKTIYLTNCRKLQSIPELPPSVMHLDATNCTSLKNVFPITTSAAHQEDILSYFFSFVNCLKLDEHSLCKIMDNAYLSLKRAVHNNFEASVFCHPSSSVPRWFRCKQTTKASVVIQLSPAVDELLGLVLCVVLPRYTSNEIRPTYLKCSCYFEDGEKFEGSSTCGYSITELYSDHVFLWHDPQYCKFIVEGVKTKLAKAENVVPKVSFEFYAVTYDDDNGESSKHEGLIKECGVHPIYTSEQEMQVAPLTTSGAKELKMKSKKEHH